MLNEYLEEYNANAGLLRKPSPLPWITSVFPLSLLMEILTYLTLEEIAQLMVLNKAFNARLNHQDLWKVFLSGHFPFVFFVNKNKPTVNWSQLFKTAYVEKYRGMDSRTKALFLSVKLGHLHSLIALNLEMNDLHLLDGDGYSLGYYALKNLNRAVCDYIYEGLILPFYTDNGEINYGKKDKKGFRFLHWVSALGRVDDQIKSPALINVVSECNNTPLFMAAQHGHLGVVNALIDAKANIKIAALGGVTPLMAAAQHGHLEVVNTLIAARSDVNANTSMSYAYIELYYYGYRGITPLFLAAENGHLGVVGTLIHHAADINTMTVTDETPLDVAIKNNHIGIAKTISRVKLDQVTHEIARGPVSKHTFTLFGIINIKYAYSKEEKLCAAAALKNAVDTGNEALLNEHRRVLESTEELKPLYRHLI